MISMFNRKRQVFKLREYTKFIPKLKFHVRKLESLSNVFSKELDFNSVHQNVLENMCLKLLDECSRS